MNQSVHLSPAERPARKRGVAAEARTNDPERTRADILQVATGEFADKGLAGARIDEIAAATRTSKRMIYYYFGSKEGLYVAVLEEAYRRIRQIETELHLDDLQPEAALRTLVGFTFDYHWHHPEFPRLVMNENIQQLNASAINAVGSVYQRGVQAGVFRPGLDLIDLHMSISALSFFNVSNRHTFTLSFQRDIAEPAALAQRRAHVIDMVLRYVQA